MGQPRYTKFMTLPQIVLLHQPPHLLRIDDKPAVAELGIHAAIAVAFELVGDDADFSNDRPVVTLAGRLGVEAGSPNTHQLAPPLDGETGGPTVTDVGALLGEGLER